MGALEGNISAGAKSSPTGAYIHTQMCVCVCVCVCMCVYTKVESGLETANTHVHTYIPVILWPGGFARPAHPFHISRQLIAVGCFTVLGVLMAMFLCTPHACVRCWQLWCHRFVICRGHCRQREDSERSWRIPQGGTGGAAAPQVRPSGCCACSLSARENGKSRSRPARV